MAPLPALPAQLQEILPKFEQWQVEKCGHVVLGNKSSLKWLADKCQWRIDKLLERPQTPSKPSGKYTPQQQQRGRHTQSQRADGRSAQAYAAPYCWRIRQGHCSTPKLLAQMRLPLARANHHTTTAPSRHSRF